MGPALSNFANDVDWPLFFTLILRLLGILILIGGGGGLLCMGSLHGMSHLFHQLEVRRAGGRDAFARQMEAGPWRTTALATVIGGLGLEPREGLEPEIATAIKTIFGRYLRKPNTPRATAVLQNICQGLPLVICDLDPLPVSTGSLFRDGRQTLAILHWAGAGLPAFALNPAPFAPSRLVGLPRIFRPWSWRRTAADRAFARHFAVFALDAAAVAALLTPARRAALAGSGLPANITILGLGDWLVLWPGGLVEAQSLPALVETAGAFHAAWNAQPRNPALANDTFGGPSQAVGPFESPAAALPLFLLLLGAVALAAWFNFVRVPAERASVNWPTTQGVVTSGWPRVTAPSEQFRLPPLEYRYTVAGKTYTSKNLYSNLAKDTDLERAINSHHPAGSTLTVYYNPAAPDEAMIVPGVSNYALRCVRIFLVVSLALFGFMGGGFALGLRDRRIRRMEQAESRAA